MWSGTEHLERLVFLIRVTERGLVLPAPKLLPMADVNINRELRKENILLLRRGVLNEHFNTLLRLEVTDEPRVPNPPSKATQQSRSPTCSP